MRHAFMIAAVLCLGASAALAALKPAAVAPDFTVQAALGGKDFSFSLAAALMKGPVVLYFYPKSFTSVCTEEAHLFAEAMNEFTKLGASVIGVSGDDIKTQREFSSLECRDKFPVAADFDRKIILAYDVGADRSAFAARVSYVISPDHRIISAVSDPGAEKHIVASLAAVRTWRAAHAS